MPNHRLKCLAVRGDGFSVDDGNDDDRVSNLLGIATITANHAKNSRAAFFSFIQSMNDIGADVALRVSAANREHQNRVFFADSARAQPRGEHRRPTLVIGSSGQFRNIVNRGIGLDTAELAKVINRVATVRRASTDPKKKQTPSTAPHINQFIGDALDRLMIDIGRDPRDLVEIGPDMRHRFQPFR